MTVDEAIDTYTRYVRGELRKIARLKRHDLWRKLLYIVMLDFLSICPYPNEKAHRKRFVCFVDEFSNWVDKDRVSALMLKLYLEKDCKTSGTLYRKAKEWIDGWGDPKGGAFLKPDRDPWFSCLESVAVGDEMKTLEDSRYARLLYTYRNNLVHEYRESDLDFGFKRKKSPYYYGMSDSDEPKKEGSWEFVFPAEFLHGLCLAASRKLSEYLCQEQRDPWESYKGGTLWQRK